MVAVALTLAASVIGITLSAGPAAAKPSVATRLVGGATLAAPIEVQDPGTQISIIGDLISLQMTATGGNGSYTWTAGNLPPGLSINSATGLISGRVGATPGGFTRTTVTAAGLGLDSVTFRWQVTRDVCPTC